MENGEWSRGCPVACAQLACTDAVLSAVACWGLDLGLAENWSECLRLHTRVSPKLG